MCCTTLRTGYASFPVSLEHQSKSYIFKEAALYKTTASSNYNYMYSTRQMIIIVGGEPDVHGATRHAKWEGGVYPLP